MMLKVFGKRKSRPIPILLPERCKSPEAQVWGVTSAVVDYVNFMRQHALFRDAELPEQAIFFYYTDYYYAQVCNGGHSQFVHNATNAKPILEMAVKLFTDMEFAELASIATQFLGWIDKNPDEAAKQDGFETRHPDLEELDTAFYEAINDDKYFIRAGRYLSNLSNIRFVADDRYEAELRSLISTNSEYNKRKIAARANEITLVARDRTWVGIQLAAFEADDDLVIERINAGQPTTVKGEDTLLWGVTTSKGFLWGCVCSSGAFVAPKTDEGVGKVLGLVPAKLVSDGVDHAAKFNIGALVVELFKKAGITEDILYAICAAPPEGDETSGLYLVKTQTALRRAIIDVKKCALFDYDDPALLSEVNTKNVTDRAEHLSGS